MKASKTKNESFLIVFVITSVVCCCVLMSACGRKNSADADLAMTDDTTSTAIGDNQSDTGADIDMSGLEDSANNANGVNNANDANNSNSASNSNVTNNANISNGANSANGAVGNAGVNADRDESLAGQAGNGSIVPEGADQQSETAKWFSAAGLVEKDMAIEIDDMVLDAKPGVNGSNVIYLPLEDVCKNSLYWECTREERGFAVTYTLVFNEKETSTMTIVYRNEGGRALEPVYMLGKQTLKLADDMVLVNGKPYLPYEYYEIMQFVITENMMANKIVLDYK